MSVASIHVPGGSRGADFSCQGTNPDQPASTHLPEPAQTVARSRENNLLCGAGLLAVRARLRRAAYTAARSFSMAEFDSSQGGVSHIATRAQVLRIARYCEMQSHAATLHGVVGNRP